MINIKKALLLLTLVTASFGASAASVLLDWNVVAGPITSNVAIGGDVTTHTATLYEGTTELGTGTIDTFKLNNLEEIKGTFTGVAGTYSIMGKISSIDFFTIIGSTTLSHFFADNNISEGSLSKTSGSSSLDLFGSTLDFTAVPVPAAIWLFGSGLIGLVAVARRRSK